MSKKIVRTLLGPTLAFMPILSVATANEKYNIPATPYTEAWSIVLDGWNRSSSPVIADVDDDGRNDVIFGHQDGILRAYEGDGTLKWATPAIPGINKEQDCHPQQTPTAIDSSPAVADVDNDGDTEVVVGLGSTFAPNQNGSVISVNGKTGEIEWAFDKNYDNASLWAGQTPIPDRWCEATYATPAIGDVNGDGNVDIVFASWDFRIWAVDGQGHPLPGFPVNNDDTVWSSPALFDLDNDGDVEIFIGGDSTPGGYIDHLGGIFRAFDYRTNGPVSLWHRYANEVFHSSPAIGDINGDGRYEAIVGMGNNWHIECNNRINDLCLNDSGSDHTKVWAFHLDDGTDVPGWPVTTNDTVWASPALGDIDGDGQLEVIVGSFDRNVYAWNGDGHLLWRVTPHFPHPDLTNGRATGHPIVGDLDGDGDQDVAIGIDIGLAVLDGRDGTSLEMGLAWQELISFAVSYEAAPAIGDINGSRHIITVAFDTPQRTTRVSAHLLPPTPSDDAWPMFRRLATRQGSISNTIGPTVSAHDIVTRDNLVAAQETLLNVYRCLFDIDSQIVPGGCTDGRPAQGPSEPSLVKPPPSLFEVAARDKLIVTQERLLNIYRCRFNIDTQLVPLGCRNDIPISDPNDL